MSFRKSFWTASRRVGKRSIHWTEGGGGWDLPAADLSRHQREGLLREFVARLDGGPLRPDLEWTPQAVELAAELLGGPVDVSSYLPPPPYPALN